MPWVCVCVCVCVFFPFAGAVICRIEKTRTTIRLPFTPPPNFAWSIATKGNIRIVYAKHSNTNVCYILEHLLGLVVDRHDFLSRRLLIVVGRTNSQSFPGGADYMSDLFGLLNCRKAFLMRDTHSQFAE